MLIHHNSFTKSNCLLFDIENLSEELIISNVVIQNFSINKGASLFKLKFNLTEDKFVDDTPKIEISTLTFTNVITNFFIEPAD